MKKNGASFPDARYGAAGVVSFLIALNILSIFLLVGAFTNLNLLVDLPKPILIVIALLYSEIHFLLLIHRGKHKAIIEEFHAKDQSQTRSISRMVKMYTSMTFLFLAFSLYIARPS